MESLRELPQLTEVVVGLRDNELGPGPRGALSKHVGPCHTKTTPQARRRRKSSGPPSMRCRCVRKASGFDPRPGRGPARSVVVASVGDFGAWTLSASRPQPRRAGGGLSPERCGSTAEKAEISLWWSPSIQTCRRSIAVLLWCWSWVVWDL